MMPQGIFIVLYGINNLGKTTQARMLVERIGKEGARAAYVKYPVYNLEPSGPMINAYLREGNPYELTPREAQMFYAQNRFDFEPTLESRLAQGEHIVAEDYTGTGLAWGLGAGVSREFLNRINARLRREDAVFLFDGERFTNAKERAHAHETDDELTARVRGIHKDLAKEFGWRVIDANKSIEEIHEELWGAVKGML